MFFRSKSRPDSATSDSATKSDQTSLAAAKTLAGPAPTSASDVAKASIDAPDSASLAGQQSARGTVANRPTDPERVRRIALARKKSAAFGQVVAVMSRSERHRKLPLEEVRWLVAPPVRSGQFMLAGKRVQKNGMVVPAAALVWAKVSDEIDKQLATASTPVRLAPKAWTSGENLWLIEAVGDPALVPKMIERLGSKEWKGRIVKVRSRQPDGSLGVHAIGPL